MCIRDRAESVRHSVGVQFRNQATVGGSIYGRYGFSDILTLFLALDTFVELYDGGTIRLSEFVKRKKDKDLLVSVIIRKSDRKVRYESIRQTKTDFPVLTLSLIHICFTDRIQTKKKRRFQFETVLMYFD